MGEVKQFKILISKCQKMDKNVTENMEQIQNKR